jgi:hypothetical protein
VKFDFRVGIGARQTSRRGRRRLNEATTERINSLAGNYPRLAIRRCNIVKEARRPPSAVDPAAAIDIGQAVAFRGIVALPVK